MSDYTPTTEEIRERWMNFDGGPDATDAAEFDRWLHAHDAEVSGRAESSDAPEAPAHYSSSEAFAWQAGWESRGGSWPDAPMPSDDTLSDIENRVYAQYQNKIAGMAGALIREGWIAALRAVRGVR